MTTTTDNIAANLRRLRQQEGWTQEEVAGKVYVAKETYRSYEENRRGVSLEMLIRFANLYTININDIVHSTLY